MRINKRLYCVYITTNYKKSVLYTGITNALEQRIIEHYLNQSMKQLLPENTKRIIYCITKHISM